MYSFFFLNISYFILCFFFMLRAYLYIDLLYFSLKKCTKGSYITSIFVVCYKMTIKANLFCSFLFYSRASNLTHMKYKKVQQ